MNDNFFALSACPVGATIALWSLLAPAAGTGAGGEPARLRERDEWCAPAVVRAAGAFIARSRQWKTDRVAPGAQVRFLHARPVFGVVLCRLRHGVDAGAYDHRRSCPRPTGRTISKQPCDWRGLSAADGGERPAPYSHTRGGPAATLLLPPFPSPTRAGLSRAAAKARLHRVDGPATTSPSQRAARATTRVNMAAVVEQAAGESA